MLLVAWVTNGCRPADNLCLLGPLICCTFAADSCLTDLICRGETAAGRSTVHGALQTRMCDVALMVCMLQVHTACWWFCTRPTPSLTTKMLLGTLLHKRSVSRTDSGSTEMHCRTMHVQSASGQAWQPTSYFHLHCTGYMRTSLAHPNHGRSALSDKRDLVSAARIILSEHASVVRKRIACYCVTAALSPRGHVDLCYSPDQTFWP